MSLESFIHEDLIRFRPNRAITAGIDELESILMQTNRLLELEPPAKNILGKWLWSTSGQSIAFQLFESAAEDNYLPAMYNEAMLLLGPYGDPLQAHLDSAIELLTRASDKGHAGSQSALGCCYFEGFGVDKDDITSTRLFSKAAEQGDQLGMFRLAVAYALGIGTYTDQTKAVDLLMSLTKQSYRVCQQGVQEFQRWSKTPRLLNEKLGTLKEYDEYYTPDSTRTADGKLNKEKFESINERLLAAVFERADEITSASKGGRPTEGYEPRKESRIRLEPLNIEWLKAKGPNHLSRINGLLTALREAEEGELPNLEK